MDKLKDPLFHFLVFAVIVLSYGIALGMGVASESLVMAGCVWLGLPILLSWWVQSDMRETSFRAPYEFGFLVFLFWPVVIPFYMWKSRGKEGVPLMLLLLLAMFAPVIGYGIGLLLRA